MAFVELCCWPVGQHSPPSKQKGQLFNMKVRPTPAIPFQIFTDLQPSSWKSDLERTQVVGFWKLRHHLQSLTIGWHRMDPRNCTVKVFNGHMRTWSYGQGQSTVNCIWISDLLAARLHSVDVDSIVHQVLKRCFDLCKKGTDNQCVNKLGWNRSYRRSDGRCTDYIDATAKQELQSCWKTTTANWHDLVSKNACRRWTRKQK